ncbi:unnamed protein product [Mytilus coruscus]|uniref:Uncharacterized protein n=1 Tax=Mytilus coruscus TaxID=42192 RepID=A0A6J8ATT2_MYTCO|nr:unnamed protein product [Mytilus coruscus]
MSEGETEHSHISTGNSQSSNHIVEERRDLADTFELFKVYFDNKLVDLKSDLVREQDVISKKLKEEVSLKFKHEGNKIQYKFNEENITELNKVYSFVPRSETKVSRIIIDLIDKVKGRNKLIRIADTSAGGWATVREYEANVIASDSEDEKKIRQAESRAMRTAKDKSRRPHHYKTTSRPMSISISVRTRRPFESAAGGVSRPSTTCAMPVSNSVTGERTVHFSNATSSTSAIHNRTINNEQEIPYISARNLAQVTGRIISMSPVIGNITRIMTRYCYMSIESRMSWDSYLVLEKFSILLLTTFGGPYTVDRFASSRNAKLERFNSLFWNVNTEAVDCFTQNWCGENNWIVPPIYLVLRAIKHEIACKKLKGTLIVPKWISATYWPFIFDKNMNYRDYISDVIEFENTSGIFVSGSNRKFIFGTEPFIAPVLAVKLDATRITRP